jgi:nitronate monooxygenase
VRTFLRQWGPEVSASAADAARPDFAAQCEAVLACRPAVISSIMGLFPPPFVARMKSSGIRWFATATTVTEARAAEAAGADAIVAQGMEAGGHRGAFDPASAESTQVGLFSLLPAVVDAVKLPVVAAGGIADARGIAAALILGASAVEIGTGFLRCPEAALPPAWAEGLGRTLPEHTRLTRAFSGRRSRTRAVPGAARPDPRHARGRRREQRSRPHAGLGRSVRCARTGATGRRAHARALAGGDGAAGSVVAVHR